MNSHQTNNDLNLFQYKVLLRLKSLPDKNVINVLEAFSGDGLIWDSVKKHTDKTISITPIDIKKYDKTNLLGNNLKFLKSFDLSNFDIIDLDAYGSPTKQLQILKSKNYIGIVHCTFIQSVMGCLSNDIIYCYGYTPKMLKKCKTIFYKDGLSKFYNYLCSLFGINSVIVFSNKYNKKHYLYFTIK